MAPADGAHPATTTFAARDGRTLSYRVRGRGPRVVMLPGGPGMDPWAYFSRARLTGVEQILFAPRGTGASDPPASSGAYRLADYVADVEDLRAHLDEDQLTLYGSGHGMSVALAYCRAHPSRVDRMVLVNGLARFDARCQREILTAQQRYAAEVPGGARQLELVAAAEESLDLATSDDHRRAANRAVLATHIARRSPAALAFVHDLAAAPRCFEATASVYDELIGGIDLIDGLQLVSTPTLVLASRLDPTVPAEHMSLIAESLPHSAYAVFDQVGHFIEVEAYTEWSRVVTAFLALDPHRRPQNAGCGCGPREQG